MSASEKAVEILCSQCPESQYLCGCLVVDCHAASELRKAIAEAQLEAVEKWMAMTYDCIGNNGVISNEHFNYLAALRKAAGKGE